MTTVDSWCGVEEFESKTPEQFASFLRDDSAERLRLIKLTGGTAE